MSFRSIQSAMAACALLASPAVAIILINDDQQTHTIEVAIGEAESAYDRFELDYDHAADEFCTEGCKIRLGNSEEMSLSDHEVVAIRDGNFVIAD